MRHTYRLTILLLIFLLSLGVLLSIAIPPEALQLSSMQSLMEKSGAFGPLLFIAIGCVATLCFFSTVALAILAGILFGPILGSIYSIIAIVASNQIAFFLARMFGAELLHRFADARGFLPRLITKIRRSIRQGGLRTFLLCRFLLVPPIQVSYAAGLIKESRALDFFFATLLAHLVLTPIFVTLGNSVVEGQTLFILLGALIVLILLPLSLSRWKPAREIESL